MGHVGFPALLECLVRDVLFDGSDADRTEAVVQRAGTLAQPILGADPSAHFGQRVRLVGEFGRFE